MTDKNLFMYDLAIVAIMKNEGPYIKEWLDYHLLAGVDHFYIYDNESPDNMKEVLQPSIDAGIVTYHFYPGKARQNECSNDAVQNYKFFCRYLAVIDGDEFIFPRNGKNIVDVVDEVIGDNQQIGGLGANWIMFGSNYHEKADYSKGVLERFTRREANVNIHIKTITNPRKVDYFRNPHFAMYFENYYCVNEDGEPVIGAFNDKKTADKISINHYFSKSKEEWTVKVSRGTADNAMARKVESFEHNNNDVFDGSIIKYRDTKLAEINLENLTANKNIDYNRIFNALTQNLLPMFSKYVGQEFFTDKMETFLTCRAMSSYLRGIVLDESAANFFEELSLKAIYRTLFTQISIADIKLLIQELPRILPLNYPIVKDIRAILIEMIPQLMNIYRVYDPSAWKEFVNLKYLIEMLKIMQK